MGFYQGFVLLIILNSVYLTAAPTPVESRKPSFPIHTIAKEKSSNVGRTAAHVQTKFSSFLH